jgi:dihydrofolate synthase/folylpolyglutamate synthase
MNYQEAVDWLFQQFPAYHQIGAAAYNPGFKNSEELLHRIGNPQRALQFVHVGGTNGKGSVSNYLASACIEGKVKVGLFTSPHILEFTERIRVDGQPIDQQFVADFCNLIAAESWNIAPSFFEITWAMALAYFRATNCELVIAEVGLGGRLDATNIIHPLVSVITSISLDHTQMLGDTRALIAAEKAGIIKKNVPVVCGPRDAEVLPVVEHQCAEMHATLFPTKHLDVGLIGFQQENGDLAFTAWEIIQAHFPTLTTEHFVAGVRHCAQNTGFFGRLQVIAHSPLTIVDSAHNPDGIKRLFEALQTLQTGQLHLIYGTSSDKDVAALIPYFPEGAQITLTAFDNPRSMKTDELANFFSTAQKKYRTCSSVAESVHSTQQLAKQADTIVVFGSFFLLHDFFSNFS